MVDVVMENEHSIIFISHEYKSMPLKKFNRRVKRENVLNVVGLPDEQNQNENMRSHQSTKSSTV
jgi:hypothetical protein